MDGRVTHRRRRRSYAAVSRVLRWFSGSAESSRGSDATGKRLIHVEVADVVFADYCAVNQVCMVLDEEISGDARRRQQFEIHACQVLAIMNGDVDLLGFPLDAKHPFAPGRTEQQVAGKRRVQM